jgi:hypothetical protein
VKSGYERAYTFNYTVNAWLHRSGAIDTKDNISGGFPPLNGW